MKHHIEQHEETGRKCSLMGSLLLVSSIVTGAATASAVQHGIAKGIAPFALLTVLVLTLAVNFYIAAFRNLDKADRLRRLYNEPKH